MIRSAEGEYEAAKSDQRPGDGYEELDPTLVPTFIDVAQPPEPLGVGDAAGVRRVPRRV